MALCPPPGVTWCALAVRPAPASALAHPGIAAHRSSDAATDVRMLEPGGGVVTVPPDTDELVAAFATALRTGGSTVALLVDRPLSMLRLAAGRALDLAATQPYRVSVDAAPHDPRADPLLAAVRLTASVLRRRSAAAWAALDALDVAGGNAELAARTLGISGQAVRTHRKRGHHAASELLVPLFDSLLTRR